MLERYVKKILGSNVYDVANKTPLQSAAGLSQRFANQIWLKREDLQPVHSFKLRGSYNKISQLSDEDKARGVIAASAGNHAQGVALAAQKLGIPAIIVMGRNAPEIKVKAVRNLGAKVILHGDTYDEAAVYAQELRAKEGYVFVHPFDDVDVIAGQGSVGVEILNQHGRPLDAIFVPIGGGGLISGIAVYVKYLQPETLVIGVEADGSASMTAALKANRRVKLPRETLDLFADGASVAQVGKETFKITKKYVDEVLTVNTDEICAAVKDIFDDTRAVAEPAGALAVAGMKKYIQRHALQGKEIVAVVSGSNVNFDRLRHVAERAEVGEHREAIVGVAIPEKQGSFRRFCRTLGKRNITEFNYRQASNGVAHIYAGVQTTSFEDRQKVLATLRKADYDVTDMTDNETAKLHVRHMVGGRVQGDRQELIYRFVFPERPGALMQFLTGLGAKWDITLFHYRNHGAAWGRVLVGFSAADSANKKDRRELNKFLDRIGYRYWDETDNPAYDLFLR